jgi:hypothetical protein
MEVYAWACQMSSASLKSATSIRASRPNAIIVNLNQVTKAIKYFYYTIRKGTQF